MMMMMMMVMMMMMICKSAILWIGCIICIIYWYWLYLSYIVQYYCYIKYGGIITNLTMKSLWVYYWYVKMPRCGCMEGLEYITFYVNIYIYIYIYIYRERERILSLLFWTPAGSRWVASGARICENRFLFFMKYVLYIHHAASYMTHESVKTPLCVNKTIYIFL